MIRRPPRSTPLYSSAASDVYKRQALKMKHALAPPRKPVGWPAGRPSRLATSLSRFRVSGFWFLVFGSGFPWNQTPETGNWIPDMCHCDMCHVTCAIVTLAMFRFPDLASWFSASGRGNGKRTSYASEYLTQGWSVSVGSGRFRPVFGWFRSFPAVSGRFRR